MMIRSILALVMGLVIAIGGVATVAAQEATTTLTGTLTKVGNTYFIDGEEADFGPSWYRLFMSAQSDYDGDGSIGTLEEELDGLVGAEVTVVGQIGRGDDIDVFTLNGMEYRNPTVEPAPWAGGPFGAGSPGGDDDNDGNHGSPPFAGRGDEDDDGPPAFVTDGSVGPPPWAGDGDD